MHRYTILLWSGVLAFSSSYSQSKKAGQKLQLLRLRQFIFWFGFISSSVQFSPTVMSDFLQPHGQQQTRLPCLSSTFGACSNSCPLSRWCHPTISSSVVPFSSCLQSFPASGSFPKSQFFASDGQSIETSASASVLPMNIQDWFPIGWTELNWTECYSLKFRSLVLMKVWFFH